MSHVRRIEREPPERSPCQLMLEELANIWAALEQVSLRVVALERDRAGNCPATRPEAPKKRPPASCAGNDDNV
jgi:hypothetical protein